MDMKLYEPFIEGVKTIIMKMTGIEATVNKPFYPESNEIQTKGITSIINYSGEMKGRLMLDMGQTTAIAFTKKITGRSFDSAKEHMVLATVSELNNIITGEGITYLNNEHSLGFKLSPPIVFAGKEALVCLDKIPSQSIIYTTIFGELKVNVAFEERGL